MSTTLAVGFRDPRSDQVGGVSEVRGNYHSYITSVQLDRSCMAKEIMSPAVSLSMESLSIHAYGACGD